MRTMGTVLLGVLLSFGSVRDADAQERGPGPRAMAATFLLDISVDGKPISDTFELWSLQGTIAPMRPTAASPIALTAVVFTALVRGRTDVLVEPHDTLSILEVQPALFRLRFSGNGKGCSDLEIVARYSTDFQSLLDLSGSARGGVNCEHVYSYKLAREKTRALAPLTNGLYLAFPSLTPR